jgi:hypothetical protein
MPEREDASLTPSLVDRLEQLIAKNRVTAGLILTWLCLLLMAFYYLGVALLREVYAGDMAFHTPWAYRIRDPGLFPGDVLTDYFQQFSPIGVKAIYYLGAPFVDSDVIAEFSVFPLCALVLFLLYRTGKLAAGNRRIGGWIAIALTASRLIDVPNGVWFHWFQGNFARCYAFVVMLLAVYGALSSRAWMMGAACLIGALFYPPSAITVAGLCGLLFLFDRHPLRERFRAWLPGIALACVGALYLVSMPWAHGMGDYGELFNLRDATHMPEFGPRGPSPMILPKAGVLASMAYLRFGIHPAFAAVVLLYGWSAWRGHIVPRTEARIAALLSVTGLGLFFAAYALLMKLYEPWRYTYLSFFTASILLAVPLATSWLDRLGGWLPTIIDARGVARRGALAAGLTFVILATIATSVVTYRRYAGGRGGNVARATPDIYAAIQQQPKGTMIGGHPLDVFDIPLFAKRPVFLPTAAMSPYYRKFYEIMHDRWRAYTRAASATSWEEVLKFAREYRVDMLLVNSDRYGSTRPEWIPIYDEEFDKAMGSTQDREVALLRPPPERVVAKSGPFTLVDVREAR